MIIQRYTSKDSPLWDTFVKASRNGTFLHLRGYMDYHSDRFEDYSLMYYKGNRLIAILPASIIHTPSSLISHPGLTFAGFILAKEAKSSDVLELFEITIGYLRSQGFRQFVYKPAPTIYHLIPSQDEEYALWRNGAKNDVCNLSVSIDLQGTEQICFDARRMRGIRKAQRSGYSVVETGNLDAFWPIVEQNLMDRYGATPVHTIDEIKLLQGRFPHNIRTWVAVDTAGQIQGGVVIFESQQVAHCQYPHATASGKSDGVMDLLFYHIIQYYKNENPAIRYFDFGTSNEQRGLYLNPSLISYKEGFGARGVVYKTYTIDL